MTDAPASSTQPTATPNSPATTTQQPNPADAAAKPPVTPTPDGAKPNAEKPGDQEQFLFEGDKPKDVEGGEKPPGEADKPKEGEGDYKPVDLSEITVPEDMPIPEEIKAPLTEYATKNKLSKEQTQELIDLGIKREQQNIDFWNNTKAEWRKEIETDPELGGANLAATKSQANNVIRQFAGSEENLKELQQDLILLGLGNKRSFVRFLSNVAKATGNDKTHLDGAPGNAPSADTTDAKAKRMYPNMA